MTNIKEKAYISKHLKGYLPMNFDIDRHLSEYPPDFNLDRDNLIYILSLIVRIPARAERTDSEYVPLKAEYLYNKIKDYRKYLSYCVDTGILETDGQYIPGRKSKGFKFCDRFITRVAGYDVVKYSLVKADNKEREQKNQQTARKYSYLTDHFNDNLTIDYNGARELILDHSQTAQQYNYSLVHLDDLKERNFRYNVDSTAFRFHSNLTNLKSDFRQFLTYGDQHLVSVDIRNSQPFFSLCLFDPGFYEKNEGQLSIYSLFPYYSNNTIIPLMIGLVDNEDVTKYKKLVLEGQLYEYLAREVFDEFGITYESRRDLKTDFFWGFYSPNQTIGNPDAHLRRVFKSRFPSVYELFSLLKRGDHKFFPILLQRIESYLVIEQICTLIAQERPFLPLYTIHDSIITTEGNEGYISATMTEQIEMITGFHPQLKVETWKKEKL